MSTKKPTVKLKCPANQHAAPGERIIEFTFPNGKGGLISFFDGENGPLVNVYDHDKEVTANVALPLGVKPGLVDEWIPVRDLQVHVFDDGENVNADIWRDEAHHDITPIAFTSAPFTKE